MYRYQTVNGCLYNVVDSDKIIIIVPAAGVLQSFNKDIAQFFQWRGISTVTFDYTGVGASLVTNIRKEKSSLTDWGSRDLHAVIVYIKRIFPTRKIVLLGHSMGGQLIGLAPASCKANKIILVAAQSGYWGFWKGADKIKMWTNWHLLVPAITKAFGYFPSRTFSRMQPLPKNAAREWAEWCRSSNYLFASLAPASLYFDKIKCALTAISIDDDFFAPKKSVAWLTGKFENARVKRLHLAPASYNTPKIGHFLLFTEKFKHSIWNLLLHEADN